MRKIIEYFKYLILICCFLFLFKLTKHYGNYKESVYDIFLILILSFIILFICLNLYLRNKTSKRNLNLIIIVAVGIIGVFFNIYKNNQAENRKIISEYYIESNAKSYITLYEDNTFKISEYSPHIFQYWNGSYLIKNDILYLKDLEFENIAYLQISNKYFIDSNTQNYVSSGFNKLIKKK